MRILAAIDDSESSQATMERIIAQFRPGEIEVRVLHVVSPIAISAPPQMAAGFSPELEKQVSDGRRLLEKAADRIKTAGFKVDTVLLKGDTREQIVGCAGDWKADLIVVGAHGRKGISRLLLGSVADYVIRHAPCSVEVVRSAEQYAASATDKS